MTRLEDSTTNLRVAVPKAATRRLGQAARDERAPPGDDSSPTVPVAGVGRLRRPQPAPVQPAVSTVDDAFEEAEAEAVPAPTDDAPRTGTAALARRKDDTEALTQIAISREPLQIGPYRILGVIGRGGMGTVYRSEVVESCAIPVGRTVAIKLLRQIADRGERLRFGREASYLQALRHTGIVRVLDVGEHHGQPYLVMELVEGQPLNHLIAGGGRLDEAQVADIGVRALEALHVAHLAGIVHRDVKPSNIMISADGAVKLVDFGLAQRMDAASTLTATGTVIGTPAYMSPEQASGERHGLGRRSDVYSLGACCYELLTGHQPFVAETSVAVLRKILDEPLVPPSHWRPGLSRDLETIVLKAMCKHPADRYANAEAMAADLRAFRRGLRIKSRRPSRLVPLLRGAWHHRRAVASVGLVVFVVLALVGVAARQVLRLIDERVPVVEVAKPLKASVPAWTEEWRSDGVLDATTPGVRLRPGGGLGKDMVLATLGSQVPGAVRAKLTIESKGDVSTLDLMVGDRDVGKGYRLRLRTLDADNDQVALLREDKVVASHTIPHLKGRFTVSLERVNDSITGVSALLTASIEGPAVQAALAEGEVTTTALVRGANRLEIFFEDLVPIEGRDHQNRDSSAVHIAFVPAQVTVSGIQLFRHKVASLINGLVTADNLRQDRLFVRAIDAYQDFLRDNPNDRLARDAKLRLAICLEENGAHEPALATYLEVARENRDQSRYVGYSTFRAWICALRLRRYQEAEQYLDAIRNDHTLSTLLVTVAQDEVEKIMLDYEVRGELLATGEPQRAARLYTTAFDLANYLGKGQNAYADAFAAGNLQLGLQQYDSARLSFGRAASQGGVSDDKRLRALIRGADTERLLGRLDEAAKQYQEAFEKRGARSREEMAWARLWLGDLLLEQGDVAQARLIWGQEANGKRSDFRGLAGDIMRHLIDSYKEDRTPPTSPLQPFTDRALFDKLHHDKAPGYRVLVEPRALLANDFNYFNARLALLHGQDALYRERLTALVNGSAANDWPTPLARHLLDRLPPESIEPPPAP